MCLCLNCFFFFYIFFAVCCYLFTALRLCFSFDYVRSLFLTFFRSSHSHTVCVAIPMVFSSRKDEKYSDFILFYLSACLRSKLSCFQSVYVCLYTNTNTNKIYWVICLSLRMAVYLDNTDSVVAVFGKEKNLLFLLTTMSTQLMKKHISLYFLKFYVRIFVFFFSSVSSCFLLLHFLAKHRKISIPAMTINKTLYANVKGIVLFLNPRLGIYYIYIFIIGS